MKSMKKSIFTSLEEACTERTDAAIHTFLAVLYEKHGELFALAYYYVWDIPAAEDLTHDIFLKVLSHLDAIYEHADTKYGPSEEDKNEGVMKYLGVMVRNHCLDFLRSSERRRNFAAGIEEFTDSLYICESSEEKLSDQLLSAIDRLPRKIREPLRLKWLEEKSWDQIARALKISVSTAQRRVQQGIVLLRNKLKEQDS